MPTRSSGLLEKQILMLSEPVEKLGKRQPCEQKIQRRQVAVEAPVRGPVRDQNIRFQRLQVSGLFPELTLALTHPEFGDLGESALCFWR